MQEARLAYALSARHQEYKATLPTLPPVHAGGRRMHMFASCVARIAAVRACAATHWIFYKPEIVGNAAAHIAPAIVMQHHGWFVHIRCARGRERTVRLVLALYDCPDHVLDRACAAHCNHVLSVSACHYPTRQCTPAQHFYNSSLTTWVRCAAARCGASHNTAPGLVQLSDCGCCVCIQRVVA